MHSIFGNFFTIILVFIYLCTASGVLIAPAKAEVVTEKISVAANTTNQHTDLNLTYHAGKIGGNTAAYLIENVGSRAEFTGNTTLYIEGCDGIYGRSRWAHALQLGTRSGGTQNAVSAAFYDETGKNSDVTIEGHITDFTASPVSVRGGNTQTIDFNNTGNTKILGTSNYGINGLSGNSPAVVNFNGGDTVLIQCYLDASTGGVGVSNVNGMNFSGGTITVSSDVNTFKIQTEGAGSLTANGTAAIYMAKSTGTVNINSKNLILDVKSGQDTEHFTFDATKATDKYSTAYGVWFKEGAQLKVSKDTQTTITTSDPYKNSIGIYVTGAGSKAEILGDTTITSTGGDGTYSVFAENGGTVILGSEGKTVNLIGDVIANGSGSTINLKNATLGDSHTYTAQNEGTIVMESGTLATYDQTSKTTTKQLAGYFGTGHRECGFVLDKAAVLDTTSDQVFTTALKTFAPQDPANPTAEEKLAYVNDNQSSGAVKATQIDFRGGSVQLNDANYTLAYVTAAKEALTNASTLGEGKGLTSLVMMGDLVTAEGVNITTVDQIDDQTEPTPETQVKYDKVTAATVNGSLLVGTNTILSTEGAVEEIKGSTKITVRDTAETSISVDKIDLAETSTGIIITNDKSLTLGGASGRDTETASIVEVRGEERSIDVIVGLDQATATAIGVQKKGTLTIGNGVEDTQAKYKVTGNVIVNEESELDITAKTDATITKDLTLKGATVKVKKDGVLNVGGTATVAEDTQNTISGTVKGSTLINNGTLKAFANDLQFGTIENNSMHTLELTGGEITADIKAASGKTGAVKITGNVRSLGRNFDNQYITVNSGAEFYFGGGTTTITGGGLSAQNATLAFCLDGFAKGSTIVDATKAASKVDVTGTNIALYQNRDSILAKGESINLIAGATGNYQARDIDALREGQGVKIDTYSTYLNGNNLVAELKGAGRAAKEVKSLSEGFLSGVALLMQANDLSSDSAMVSAKTAIETAKGKGYVPYAVIQGGHGRYNTGGYIDLNSTQVAAGLAKRFSDATVAGLLIEGGNGRYTSYNEFSTGNIRADGEINYYGMGIFARHAFNKTDGGNAYLDAAFAVGRTRQDYRTSNILSIQDYHYDTKVTYLKAHATLGYALKLVKGTLESYVKYLWALQNGATIQFNGQDVNLDTINSHRLRVGARYTQNIQKSLAWYGGLAYEYEFDASAGASSTGFAILAPDLKGGSGMAELGLKYVPQKADAWLFDLGFQGFTGKRDSFSVRLATWYRF